MIHNGQTITAGLLLRALKKLNKDLRVCSYGNSNRLAGVYLRHLNELPEEICGVDKSTVPAYASFDDTGHITKSGWRRVFWILYGSNYTTREKIKRVCPGFFDSRACRADRFVGGVSGDPVDNKLSRYMLENDGEALSADQVLDLGADIQARDTPEQREERARDKWFLETWKKRGGNATDKPKL